MNKFYYHDHKPERVYFFPLNAEEGFSVFKTGKGIPWTQTEVKQIGAKIITKAKAKRIIGSERFFV